MRCCPQRYLPRSAGIGGLHVVQCSVFFAELARSCAQGDSGNRKGSICRDFSESFGRFLILAVRSFRSISRSGSSLRRREARLGAASRRGVPVSPGTLDSASLR